MGTHRSFHECFHPNPLPEGEGTRGFGASRNVMSITNRCTRRKFVRLVVTALAGLEALFMPIVSTIGRVFASSGRIVVPRGTERSDLVNKDPKTLDTRNLEITPIKEFETMGLEDYQVDLDAWRLIVDGAVDNPLRLTYSDVFRLPVVEKQTLLICPNVFVNNGVWKGLSVKALLEKAQVARDANYVTFRGPEGNYESTMRIPMADVESGKVILAYAVNGKILPRKHGFPLRLVAEDYYGHDWVKYVYRMTADSIRT